MDWEIVTGMDDSAVIGWRENVDKRRNATSRQLDRIRVSDYSWQHYDLFPTTHYWYAALFVLGTGYPVGISALHNTINTRNTIKVSSLRRQNQYNHSPRNSRKIALWNLSFAIPPTGGAANFFTQLHNYNHPLFKCVKKIFKALYTPEVSVSTKWPLSCGFWITRTY